MSSFIFHASAPEQEDAAEEMLFMHSRLANFIMIIAQLLPRNCLWKWISNILLLQTVFQGNLCPLLGFHKATLTCGQETKTTLKLLERCSPAKVTSVGATTENYKYTETKTIDQNKKILSSSCSLRVASLPYL